jgi:glycosyltransferase involved in cell wall biosynthesis
MTAGWLIVAGDFVLQGGMDRANRELARYLATDAPVHLVAHRVDPELAAHPNVTVHIVPRPFGKHLLGQPLLAHTGRQWAARLAREGFRVVVNGGNCLWPDVNWVHCVHAAYPTPKSGGAIRRLKQEFVHSRDRRSERRAIRSARLVLCNSRRTANDVVERLGVRAERVRVVYFGCEPQRLTPVTAAHRAECRRRLGWDDRPWVAFVGQLGNRVKGFDTLFAAWERLGREVGWDANLVVVGDGPDRPAWQSRAIAHGLVERVRFLGFRTDVPEILAACDAVVAPSRYDAYGLAVHEALCRGLPAIVSAKAGISERYPPHLQDLILQDPEDVGELTERLRHWRTNLENYTARVRPFADELRSRTWADMARDIRDLVLATP